MRISYKYNNIDLKTYGVSVSKGRGFLNAPARKKPKTYEYPDSNGYLPDLSSPVYEARTVTLDCFIVAASAAELVSKLKTFSSALLGVTSLVPFSVSIDSSEVFSGSVYATDVSDPEKTFVDGKNVATFKVTIVEPEPVVS